jgi:uncharacterized protein YbjT (DUF2867 family)
MSKSILVTGGTGTLGRLLVPRLRTAGFAVRVLSRSPHLATDGVEYVVGDLSTGAGVDLAVAGVDVIMHAAGSTKGDGAKAQRLVEAARRAGGRPHLIYISVVGADTIPVTSAIDRMTLGYFAEKRIGEIAVAESGLPWTTLRATQFHDLALVAVRGLAKLPVIPAPRARVQPVDAGEVADRLVELALNTPAGLVPDIAGPRVYGMDELIRGYLQATGRRRPMISVSMPGRGGKAYMAGANLAPDRAVGTRTWEEFRAEKLATANHN